MPLKDLKRVVRDHEQYERAKRCALAAMKKGFHMGGKIKAARDDLHDRQDLR